MAVVRPHCSWQYPLRLRHSSQACLVDTRLPWVTSLPLASRVRRCTVLSRARRSNRAVPSPHCSKQSCNVRSLLHRIVPRAAHSMGSPRMPWLHRYPFTSAHLSPRPRTPRRRRHRSQRRTHRYPATLARTRNIDALSLVRHLTRHCQTSHRYPCSLPRRRTRATTTAPPTTSLERIVSVPPHNSRVALRRHTPSPPQQPSYSNRPPLKCVHTLQEALSMLVRHLS